MRGCAAFESLTTGKPASCSAALPGMDAQPSPTTAVLTPRATGARMLPRTRRAWWQVDLGRRRRWAASWSSVTMATNVTTAFTVEVSGDGRAWTMAADKRDNKELSTQAGYTCVSSRTRSASSA